MDAKEYRKKIDAGVTALQRNQAGYGFAMTLSGQHVYGGTVDPVVIEQRRAANRQARKSRRINRKRNK